jgi:hypothetical protein
MPAGRMSINGYTGRMPVNAARIAMHISPLSTLSAATAAMEHELKPSSQKGFKNLLEQHTAAYQDARKEAEKAASGLVSEALILPIFKQIRRSMEETKGPFSPGIAEKSFGPRFDMQLADRIAQSPRLGVKKALADRLMKRMGTEKVLNVHG